MSDRKKNGTAPDSELSTSAVRTITDLARIAGVSAGTVSRALAGNPLVNAKTKDRIQNLAREHGFQLNQMASRLRRQTTGVIGVIIPMGHDQLQQVSDVFFMTLLGHLADELTEHGYDLMLRRVIPSNDPDWLGRFIGSGMIDGVIVIGQSDQFLVIEEAADRYLPMVVWGNHREGQQHCVVGTDNRLGGAMAAKQLIAAGAKRIAFAGDAVPQEFAARFEGAHDVAKKLGVSIEVLKTHLNPETVAREFDAQFTDKSFDFDGIFAASDTIAIAALQSLRARGISVPETVKVVGFDDLPIASQTVPQLTTIRQDLASGARSIVELLKRRLAGETTESRVLPPELVVRDSC